MGLSTFPRTEAQVSALERMMAAPVPPAAAGEALRGVLEDDTLSDMLAAAGRKDPGCDARAMVAMALDELAVWSEPEGFRRGPRGRGVAWRGSFRERCARLAEEFRGDESPAALGRVGGLDAEAAELAVAACLPGGAARQGRLDVWPGTGPCSHAVHDLETGALYRVEGFYGTVMQAPESSAAAILDAVRARAASQPGH